jgi:hypothetical protein
MDMSDALIEWPLVIFWLGLGGVLLAHALWEIRYLHR